MGGECKAGEAGWEIGVYGNEVTEAGKYWWTGHWPDKEDPDRVVSTSHAIKLIQSTSSRW
jgi:hypothetical protein